MKKTYTYLILPVLAGTLLLGSCNKYLDKTPDNRTEINSVEKVSQLIASSYPKASYAAMIESRADLMTDKGIGTEHNSNTDAYFWRDVEETSQDTPDYFWQRTYFGIAGVNHALVAAEKELNDKEREEVKPYIGEAYVLRAFEHFLLASLFTDYFNVEKEAVSPGIPYVTEPETTVIKEYDRRTIKETREDIEKDLLKGIGMLGSDAVYKVPRFHFNYKAAQAFASRFYLYNGNWNKVVEHVNNVIPVPVDLLENGNVSTSDPAWAYVDGNFQPWTGMFRSVPSSDDIKAFYTRANNPSNLLLTEMSSRLSRYANTWRYGMDGNLKDDLYRVTVTGEKLAYRVYSSKSTHYYVPKFREHFVRSSINASTGHIYTIFPYFRNEELLLNRAEAFAMLDQTDKAINDLNLFARKLTRDYDEQDHVITEEKLLKYYRYKIGDIDHFLNKYDAYGAASWEPLKKAVILCILDFRHQEFKWEGLRYWDLVRYRIPVTHTTREGDSNTLYPGDDRWILQVPETSDLSGVEKNPRTNLLSKEW